MGSKCKKMPATRKAATQITHSIYASVSMTVLLHSMDTVMSTAALDSALNIYQVCIYTIYALFDGSVRMYLCLSDGAEPLVLNSNSRATTTSSTAATTATTKLW
jgi:hypothetical protein